MIVINKGQPCVEAFDFSSRCLGGILKGAVFLVVQQQDTIFETYGQIRSTIVVVITGGTADCMKCRIEPSFRVTSSNLPLPKL